MRWIALLALSVIGLVVLLPTAWTLLVTVMNAVAWWNDTPHYGAAEVAIPLGLSALGLVAVAGIAFVGRRVWRG